MPTATSQTKPQGQWRSEKGRMGTPGAQGERGAKISCEDGATVSSWANDYSLCRYEFCKILEYDVKYINLNFTDPKHF